MNTTQPMKRQNSELVEPSRKTGSCVSQTQRKRSHPQPTRTAVKRDRSEYGTGYDSIESDRYNDVMTNLSFYQGITVLSRKNLPVKSEGASVANHVTVSAPC